jgi:hypothetical protein
MEGDPLADVLTLASARCVRIGTLKAGGTWALEFLPLQKIKLTAVVKGRCWLAVAGERAPLCLETGDVFMVPAERSYVLASDLKAPQLDGLALFTEAPDSVGTVGDGKDFFAIGGHVALDPDRGGVLADVLPPVIHANASSSEASTMRWLLDQLVKEVTRGLNVECLAVREICSIVHDVARALGLDTGSRLAMRSSKRPTLRLLNKAARLDSTSRGCYCSR